MNLEGATDIKKPFLAGHTRVIRFQIVDKETGLGFQPETLLMTIYDVNPVGLGARDTVYLVTGRKRDVAVVSCIVNSRQGTDVWAMVDANGNVEVELTPEDTALEVPNIIVHTPYQRLVLFAWTWASPPRTGMHQITMRIQPNRAEVAT